MEERVTDLENRYTHQERLVQELFDTVYRQQQELDRLRWEVEQLRLALPSLVERPEDDDPPPHY